MDLATIRTYFPAFSIRTNFSAWNFSQISKLSAYTFAGYVVFAIYRNVRKNRRLAATCGTDPSLG